MPPGAPPGGPGNPADLLNIPSIIILSVAGLGVMAQLYGAIMGGGNDEQVAKMLSDPNLPAGARSFLSAALGAQRPFAIVSLLINGLAIYGGIQMRQLKMFGLAVTSAILVMIPCFTSCCCIPGLVGGIWALVVLMKPEVKSAFT